MRSLSRKFGRRVIPILFVSYDVDLVHMLISRTKRDAEYRTPSFFFFLTALRACTLCAHANFSCLTGRCAPSLRCIFLLHNLVSRKCRVCAYSARFPSSFYLYEIWAYYFRKKQIAASEWRVSLFFYATLCRETFPMQIISVLRCGRGWKAADSYFLFLGIPFWWWALPSRPGGFQSHGSGKKLFSFIILI